MSSSLPSPHPEWSRLTQKHQAITTQITAVITDAHALADTIPLVLGRYATAFGDRLVRLQAIEIDASRCKREIALLQASINKGEQWDYASIQETLDAEFSEWQKKLEIEAENFKRQQGILNHLLDPGTTKLLRDKFRLLARRLHPDLHPTQTPAEEELWHRVACAYESQNLEELDAIEIITREQNYDVLPSSLDAMYEILQRLEMKLNTLLTNLSRRRKAWPLDQLPLLDDPEATAAKQKELEERIAVLTTLRDQRRVHLNQLLAH